jgi:hypothetical protein
LPASGGLAAARFGACLALCAGLASIMPLMWREKGAGDGWPLRLLEMLMFPYQAYVAGDVR